MYKQIPLTTNIEEKDLFLRILDIILCLNKLKMTVISFCDFI